MKQMFFLLSLIFFSCNQHPEKWDTLEFEVFRLKAPHDWVKINRQGIDSYVGGLTNGKDSLWFDYGLYGTDFGIDTGNPKFSKDTINGLIAEIEMTKRGNSNLIALSMPHIGNNQFSLYGSNISDTTTILKIFKSIVFKESDTSINPPLTMDKFNTSIHANAFTLFKLNCAGCHKILEDYTGPGLKEVFKLRNKDWVYQFLTKRKHIVLDSISKAMHSKYEAYCPERPDLIKDDIDMIYHYVYPKDNTY